MHAPLWDAGPVRWLVPLALALVVLAGVAANVAAP